MFAHFVYYMISNNIYITAWADRDYCLGGHVSSMNNWTAMFACH